MTLESNIWRAIMAARMQFVFYLREKKGAVMPRGGHFIPCSDIFNGGACRTPGRSLSHVLFTTADGLCTAAWPRSIPKLRVESFLEEPWLVSETPRLRQRVLMRFPIAAKAFCKFNQAVRRMKSMRQSHQRRRRLV